MDQYLPLIVIALAFVLLIVLPARHRKRMQAQAQAMQSSLTPGTTVLTTSVMHCTVAAVGDTIV